MEFSRSDLQIPGLIEHIKCKKVFLLCFRLISVKIATTRSHLIHISIAGAQQSLPPTNYRLLSKRDIWTLHFGIADQGVGIQVQKFLPAIQEEGKNDSQCRLYDSKKKSPLINRIRFDLQLQIILSKSDKVSFYGINASQIATCNTHKINEWTP